MSIYGDTGGSDGMADTLSTAAAKPAGGAAAATSGWLHELTIRDIALGCTMLAVLVLIVSGGGAGPSRWVASDKSLVAGRRLGVERAATVGASAG